jgi:hypothetical protein
VGSAVELELSSSEHIEATLNTTIKANKEINLNFFILFDLWLESKFKKIN